MRTISQFDPGFHQSGREVSPFVQNGVTVKLSLKQIGEFAKQVAGALPDLLPSRVMDSPPTITESQVNSSTITTPVITLANSPNWRVIGTPVITWANDAQYQVCSDGNGNAKAGNYISWETASESPLVEFKMVGFNTNLTLYVDGRMIRLAPFVYGADGLRRFIKLDWSASANPRKRRIYALKGNNMPFGGMYTEATGTSWYPAELDSKPLALFFGDSYTQGTGAAATSRVYANIICDLLGWDTWNDGIGGTGYNSASPNDVVTRLTGNTSKLVRTPDVIFLPFGYNDAAAINVEGNQDRLVANYNLTIATARSFWPHTPIISIGSWTPQGTQSTITIVRNLLIAAAAANGVAYIDIDNFVSLANRAIYTGDDSVHPRSTASANEGMEYLGWRIAHLVRQMGF